MSSYTITKATEDLNGILGGTSTDEITGLLDVFSRAGRQVLLDLDPFETIRTQTLTNGLYDNVFDYSAPTDIKGNKVIDIRPQVLRDSGTNFTQTYSEQFDLYKPNNTFSVESNTGTKYVRISKSLTSPTVINSCDSLTSNGTWAATTDATNLTKDTQNYLSNGASLNFDLDGSGTTGYIENSTMAQIDLSTHENVSSLFYYVYLPDSSTVTNVILRWGNDTSNYWSVTSTAQHFGAFETGWNLIRADWNGATETGTGDASVVDYLRVTVTYDGVADTDYRLDRVISSLGQIYEMLYYSKYLFSTSGGTWQEEPTDDSDLVNLDTESYNIYLDKCAEEASKQTGDYDRAQMYKGQYVEGLTRYKKMYKSQVEKPRQNYYRTFNK